MLSERAQKVKKLIRPQTKPIRSQISTQLFKNGADSQLYRLQLTVAAQRRFKRRLGGTRSKIASKTGSLWCRKQARGSPLLLN